MPGNNCSNCAGHVTLNAASYQEIVEAFENGLELIRGGHRYSTRSRRQDRFLQPLWLLLKAPVEQPVVVSTDITKVDQSFDPTREHIVRADPELSGDCCPDRTVEALEDSRCCTKCQELLHCPDWWQGRMAIGFPVVLRPSVFRLFINRRKSLQRFQVRGRVLEGSDRIVWVASESVTERFRNAVSQQ